MYSIDEHARTRAYSASNVISVSAFTPDERKTKRALRDVERRNEEEKYTETHTSGSLYLKITAGEILMVNQNHSHSLLSLFLSRSLSLVYTRLGFCIPSEEGKK